LIHHFNIDTAGTHTCPVYSGAGSLERLPGRLKLYGQEKVFLIIDQNVDRLHGDEFRNLLADGGYDLRIFRVPPGETSKTPEIWLKAVDFCFSNGVNRKTPLVAVGGGVTGDLAGFVAASVMRGIPFIQVPTTLLAMVDSAIGGKTGINHVSGKNLIGAFYQPDSVISDIRFLETLPEREWRCGMAEVIKYGAIQDTSIFGLAAGYRYGYSEPGELNELITRCARIKAMIVSEDEREAGRRAHLNFGHTFAHALEAHTSFIRFSHGEAVYIGMVAALRLSNLLGHAVDEAPLLQFMDDYKQPLADLLNDIPALVQLMYSDKKSLGNTVRVVTLLKYGQPRVHELAETRLLHDAWNYALNACNLGSETTARQNRKVT
jgi:3-dehydroquinate synthase